MHFCIPSCRLLQINVNGILSRSFQPVPFNLKVMLLMRMSLLLCLLFSLILFPHGAYSQDVRIVGLLAGAGGFGDQSYNDMTLAGIGRAQKEYKFRLIVQETGETAESQDRALELLLEQGGQIIIVNGSGLVRLVTEYCDLNRHILDRSRHWDFLLVYQVSAIKALMT